MLDLPLAHVAHDRAAHRRSKPGLVDDLLAVRETRVLLVSSGRVAAAGHTPALLPAHEAVVGQGSEHYFLGEADDVAYLARPVPGVADGEPAALPAGLAWITPRDLADSGDPLATGLAVEAVALANWHDRAARCPRCGEPTQVAAAGWVRRCAGDDLEHYPRTDPAVIMSIVDDDDRLLLGRGPSWPPGSMSVLAGFVEPGESAEYAVAREAMEEAGVAVARIEYRASQPWPMPASLMLGFRAHAETTELRPDGDEVSELRWFTREELSAARADGSLRLSGRASIARSLIEEWFGGRIGD
ncbi:NAD(+) diphosphatase [Myceligenerans salitolerans]|uniref:NAD(+) diphosphatase n=1 Tax=Myceligenerans salitolerans TaxID=1230528 RepID=A0ABS3I7P1_9MICO|nr:NAD(+) diphosphatase [Myceligenerans salitolerans]MBO0608503.1 NAD(+) diphosphatase [Myceligenerans salitolerans]